MTRTTISKPSSLPLQANRTGANMEDDLLALKALRLLMESRMINPTEYARRLESFQRRLGQGKTEE